MDLEKLRLQLNKNVEVLEDTFKNLGLKAAKCNVISILEGGEFEFGVEVQGNKLLNSVTVKVVAYDEEGNIVGISDGHLYEDEFKGFDVLWIYLNIDGVAFRTHTIKVFAQEG